MSDSSPQLIARVSGANGCGICHGNIAEKEQTLTCPACGLVNHADCWQENFGCGTYGCQQVNILSTGRNRSADLTPPPLPASSRVHPPWNMSQPTGFPASAFAQLPWEHLLLGVSACAALLSLALHGWPSLPIWIATRVYAEFHVHASGRGLLLAAEAVCVLGFVLGQQLSS